MEKLARDPKTSGADQCFGWCCEVLSRISTLQRWEYKEKKMMMNIMKYCCDGRWKGNAKSFWMVKKFQD